MRIETDIAIVGAGPVGLMCAYLAHICGMKAVVIDKSDRPLKVGRADALNARTLQLFEIVNLFDEIYPLGKTCNTSSVWENGKFLSRESSWWEEIKGCLHKHFLMIGQSHIEEMLDKKLKEVGKPPLRSSEVVETKLNENGCITTLFNNTRIQSKYLIGADGSRSFVRENFKIGFQIEKPQIIWAVIDGVIETDFDKVPEIIVFQVDTSDVAWIPREGNIDRFYVRMDSKEYEIEEAIYKIKRAIKPHTLLFKEVVWFSQFSVKESVAEKFFTKERVFLAGDACHIHSVNGGQGLNTGLADAFNLMWKINMVHKHNNSVELLSTYQNERKPVAQSVIESSGELVRSTKYSKNGTHAKDYVKIVKERAGNITGMGIRYGEDEIKGTRLYDFHVHQNEKEIRVYSLLDYSRFTLFIFSDEEVSEKLPDSIKLIYIRNSKHSDEFWVQESIYKNQAVLVRPDSYICQSINITELNSKKFIFEKIVTDYGAQGGT